MPDYQKMYTTLFSAVTDAIRILQEAQLNTEALFIEASEPEQQLRRSEATPAVNEK